MRFLIIDESSDFRRMLATMLLTRWPAAQVDEWDPRKNGDPAASIPIYEKALAIDPKHRGAHEYIGEAYLMLGDVAKAKRHLAALDAMRNQKTLSLNLKTREAERKRIEGDRLERENTWRAAHDVKPVKSLEEIKDDAAAGILLDEASQIAADLAVAAARHSAPTQARRTDLH